eukprot:scaffold26860_cov62-Cyclotella_meneghiniana.AAC.7
MLIKPALLHFRFDGFADLPSEVDQYVTSDVQTDCNGNKWMVKLYPGGESDDPEQGWISLYLHSVEKKVDVAYRLAVKNVDGEFIQKLDYDFAFLLGEDDYSGYGSSEFILRDKILDPNNNILKNGALCVDVTIQVKDNKDDHYKPKSKLAQKMMKLLESGDGADTSFKVGSSTFPVHSQVLRSNAPILANHLPKPTKKSSMTIQGVREAVFQLMLAFVYAEQYPSDKEMLEHGKELIDAANKYELVDLKMAVEHVLVRERILTTENVSDYILFADAQSCPLLKEYAIAFLRLNAKEVIESEHSKCLKESGELLAEIMVLFAGGNEGEETLTVNELRKELGKRDLDVDGSKEALVARLEEAKRQRTE